MNLTLTDKQIRALKAFRSASFAGEVKSILEADVVARRAAFEESPATEAHRLALLEARRTIEVLFEAAT